MIKIYKIIHTILIEQLEWTWGGWIGGMGGEGEGFK